MHALAEDPAPGAAETAGSGNPWRFGMEIELTGEQVMSAALRYMEFTDEEAIRLRLEPVMNDELLNMALTPENFERLPQSLKDQLSGGSRLGGVAVNPTAPRITPVPVNPKVGTQERLANQGSAGSEFQLLGADGRPIVRGNSSIITSPNGQQGPGGSINLVRQMLPNGETTSQGLIVPKGTMDLPPSAQTARTNWADVQKRWAALDRKTKFDLISPNMYPRDVVSVLFKAKNKFKKTDADPTYLIDPTDLRPRRDLTKPVLELFERLEWVRDVIGPIEFRHREPVTSSQQLIDDIQTFARMVGINRFINEPSRIEDEVRSFSYHFHISREGADAAAIGEGINRKILLDMYDSGRLESALETRFGYSARLDDKGLIRLIAKDRLESRHHMLDVESEVKLFERYMKMETKAAVDELHADILKRIRSIEQKALSAAAGSPARNEALQVILSVDPRYVFPEDLSADVARALRTIPYFPSDPSEPDAWRNLADDIIEARYSSKLPSVVWKGEMDAAMLNRTNPENPTLINRLQNRMLQFKMANKPITEIPCATLMERML